MRVVRGGLLPASAHDCAPGGPLKRASTRDGTQCSIHAQSTAELALPLPLQLIGMNATRFARVTLAAALSLASALTVGCAMGGVPLEPSSMNGDPSVIAAAVTACIDQVNQLRAS